MASPGSVLFLVENLPLPFDRRVWLEATTLRDEGYRVIGISPSGRGYAAGHEVREGIHLYRYDLPATGTRFWHYVREYVVAMWHTVRLTMRAHRDHGLAVIHACNPPDLFFLVGWMYKPRGVRFVFDQHDLSPETFRAQFGPRRRVVYGILRLLEWLTYRSADLFIATNESVKTIGMARGGVPAERAVVVRTGPDAARLHDVPPDASLRRGRAHLACYLGVMGRQDGVDYALRAARAVLEGQRAPDTHFVFIGDGDHAPVLQALAAELGIAERAEFTGRISDEDLRRYLSTADVCLSPDPANGLNEHHTMNKTLEYMAMGRPIVAFDLRETRASAGDAALYAAANDVGAFAKLIEDLLCDPARRARLGAEGQRRVRAELSWEHTRRPLIEAYRRLMGAGA